MAGDDSYTKALLHFNGADAATTFIDEKGNAWTAVGNAQLDTAEKYFGVSSYLSDGAGDYITTPDTADWNFGSGAFTIDCWAYLNEAMGTSRCFAGLGGGVDGWLATGHEWVFFIYSDSKLYFQYKKTSMQSVASTSTIDVDAGWHHFAVVRSGDVVALYVDGVSVKSTAMTGAIDHITGGTPIMIVGASAAVTMSWKGWIDEFRISKGIARWTAAFNTALPFGEYNPDAVCYLNARRNRMHIKGVSKHNALA